MANSWFDLGPVELLAISGMLIALMILAVQNRLSYLLKEPELNDRQKRRIRPEADLARRIRLWGVGAFFGVAFSLISLITTITNEEIKVFFQNLSTIFILVAFIFIMIAYIKYLCITYVVDFYYSYFKLDLIEIKRKKEGQL